MPGTTAAAIGAPSTTKFNGLGIIADTLHHRPIHAVNATWGTFPAPLATSTPSISDIAVLNRRDAAIVYFPSIQGAADYRAYIYDPAKVTFNGTQPQGAVVACAGYRQRYVRNVDALLSGSPVVSAVKNRELIQAIEVPGLVANGNYTIIVEALASPCPFPGVLSHTNATIPVFDKTAFNYRSFADMKSIYGNELLNAQGSSLADYKTIGPTTPPAGWSGDWPARPAEAISQPVPANSSVMPPNPTVIARSAVTVTRPAADEGTNAPIFDVGPNSHFEDFSTDAIMTSLKSPTGTGVRQQGAGLVSEGQFGDWFFWTIGAQEALTSGGSPEGGTNPKGVQIWTRHGRLYDTFSDWANDIWAGVYFSSTKSRPQALDATKYVHSFFRVDSNATQRRYWQWTMCGGATQAELVDMTTGIPLARPVGQPFFFDPAADTPPISGQNPSSPKTALGETLKPFHNKECLSLVQVGDYWQWGKPAGAQSTWIDEPHSALHAVIHPAGQAYGTINLKPDSMGDGDTNAVGGMYWRLDRNRAPTRPMFEPFDQQAPLTHYDVFVRPDRVVLYVNGRQAWCADLSDKPLTMKYGHIVYGDVLYHTSAEIETDYISQQPPSPLKPVGGNFHYTMNTPWADTRVWDSVGHSEKIDIPSQFAFDALACFKPKSMVAR